jgi:hypothetical protein
MGATASFETTLLAFGNNTGIEVPDDVISALGAGRRPPVLVEVNGHAFQTTVGAMGGRSMISVSAALRKETGLAAGDDLHVMLTVADQPREVVVPDDLAAALAAEPACADVFAGLSNSLQRYHIDQIADAKTPETRQRRIEKSLALFREGKKR